MNSGATAEADEMRELQPNAETVAVKRLAGKDSTLRLSHPEAKAQIQADAVRAVTRISGLTPWKVGGPVERVFSFYPKHKETAGRCVV